MSKPALAEAPFRGAARAAAYVEEPSAKQQRPAPLPVEPAEVVVVEPEIAPELLDADVDLGALSLVEVPQVATSGVRGLLAKAGIKLAPSTAERERLAEAERLHRSEETIRRATWSRAVGILVANRKGGVGKTPTSVIVGGLLAYIRGGSVAIMEVSDDPGTLTFRTEGAPVMGIGDLVRDADSIGSAGQLAGYTAPQTSYASVIGSIGSRAQLTGGDVRRVAEVLDRHYLIRVMDSGNQPSSSAFEGAVETADALVIPVLNSADVVLEAVALLQQLRASGPKGRALADTATVIRLTDGRPENPQLVEHLTRLIYEQNVANAFTIPYDPHIAERGPITIAKLSPATRAAFTAATAGIIRTLQDRPLDHDQ